MSALPRQKHPLASESKSYTLNVRLIEKSSRFGTEKFGDTAAKVRGFGGVCILDVVVGVF